MRRIAGAITTFARADYYKQALDSLAECEGVYDNIDWYIYQDNLPNFPTNRVRYFNVSQEDVDKNIEVTLNHKFKFKKHFIEKENRGINYQINKAFNLLEEGYDTLFVFEDDLVVSPYYINLLKNCSEQHRNIAVSFHSVSSRAVKQPTTKLHQLRKAKQPRCWGWYLTKEVWDKIKHKWNKEYPFIVENRTPYYDTKITQALRKYADGKYESVVSRSKNVGIEGTLTMNEGNWRKRFLNKQSENFVYEQDRTLNNFKLI